LVVNRFVYWSNRMTTKEITKPKKMEKPSLHPGLDKYEARQERIRVWKVFQKKCISCNKVQCLDLCQRCQETLDKRTQCKMCPGTAQYIEFGESSSSDSENSDDEGWRTASLRWQPRGTMVVPDGLCFQCFYKRSEWVGNVRTLRE
jgi:hypothetical protein